MPRTPIRLVSSMSLVIAWLLVGQSLSHPPAQAQAGPPPAPVRMTVEANTAFALDLYRSLTTATGDNLLVSPLSVSTILGLTTAGARGATAAQMRKVLHLTDTAAFNTGAADLTRQLVDTEGGRRPYSLSIANALWLSPAFPIVPSFAELANRYYGTGGAFPVDFRANPDAARMRINQWVEERTMTRIKDLLPSGAVGPATAMVLTNAVYFKGTWTMPFSPRTTRTESFRVAPDRTVPVSLMTRTGTWAYFENEDAQIVSLPYTAVPGSAQRTSMLIVLPRQVDGLATIESRLTPVTLAQWIDALRAVQGQVLLPKFTFTSEFKLAGRLKTMGMTEAFRPTAADFRAMVTPPPAGNVWIDEVFHKAVVEVDEEGTEAAAATAAVMVGSGRPPEIAFTFRADHPFLFAIRHESTGSIIFMGRLTEPPSPPAGTQGRGRGRGQGQ